MQTRSLAKVAVLLWLAGCGDCAGCAGCGAEERVAEKVPQETAAAEPEPAAPEAPAPAAASPDAGIPGLPPGAGSLETAVHRAFHYFRSHDLRGDQAWAVRQGAALLGAPFEDDLEKLRLESTLKGRDDVETRMAELGRRAFPLPAALPAPEIPDDPPKVDPKMGTDEIQRVMRIMQQTIDCAQLDERARTKLLDDIRRPGATGYVLAHQLWGAVTARHLKCLDAEVTEPLRERLATEVLAELSADDAWNDLTAERAALLGYAGLIDWVPPHLLELAVATQRPDGSWPDASLDVGKNVVLPEGHTVALSFYALAHALKAEQAGRGAQ